MKEPQTLEDSHRALSELARANPAAVLLVLLDQLVDLAASGGSPVHGPLHDFIKLRFYKGVIATILSKGIGQ